MPYVPPGTSSQSCLPRKAIATTVLEQTRRKAAAGKQQSMDTKEVDSAHSTSQQAQASSSRTIGEGDEEPKIDMSAATSGLADQLEAAHIDQPAVIIPKSTSSSSLAPSSSDLTVSPTLSGDTRGNLSSDSEDAVCAYKAALYTYTVSCYVQHFGRIRRTQWSLYVY